MAGKRSYTVPILLIILTILAIVLVLAYSKLLLAQQDQAIKDGKRLSEQYNYTLIFADRLEGGAEALLQEHAATDRIKAARLFGEADSLKSEVLAMLTEAVDRSDTPSHEETTDKLQAAVAALFSESDRTLSSLAEQAGPLTADQTGLLQIVHESAAGMNEALGRFRPPTVDSGYRSMSAGADWVDPALAAGHALIEMASKLGEVMPD